MTSNVKKLRNEMLMLEEESDRYIPFDSYYILNLRVNDPEADLSQWAINFLTRKVEHQPLVTYVFGDTLSMVYSCLEEGQLHYLGGSHHKIISEYVSLLSREFKVQTNGSLVEFETRTHVITYFTWKIHSNSNNYAIQISDGSINSGDIMSKTFSELVLQLQDMEIFWDNIPSCCKYGVFYKLKKKKGKIVVVKLSEVFDSRDNKKYVSFIFG